MNERMTALADKARELTKAEFDAEHNGRVLSAYKVWWEIYSKHLINLTAQACADLCRDRRDAEIKAKRTNLSWPDLETFTGAEYAEMIEQHYVRKPFEYLWGIVIKPLQQLIDAGFPPEGVVATARKYIADLETLAKTHSTAQSAINHLNAFIQRNEKAQ